MNAATSTRLGRVPWWDLLFVLVPGISIGITVWNIAVVPDAHERTENLVALALTLAVLVIWFAEARRHLGPTARGYACLVAIVALMIGAIMLVPPLGLLQGLLYPYLWSTLQHAWRSIAMTFVIATTIALASILYAPDRSLTVVLFTQMMSIMLSIGVGLALTTVSEVADRRQHMLDELTRAQEQVRELSLQTGISRERERLSRELHDTIAQSLSGLSLLAERAARGARRTRGERGVAPATTREADDALIAQIDQIAELAKTALLETRALIAESAPVHEASGTPFDAAIERLAERFRRETGIAVDVDIDLVADAPRPTGAIPRDHQVVLLRCLQEGLSNVRRHASAARAHVRLEVRACAPTTGHAGALPAPDHAAPDAELRTRSAAVTHVPVVVLTIADDGTGFDLDADPGTGFGIPGLRDRARLLDGDVAVESTPGSGTRVVVTLPIPNVDESAVRDEVRA